MTTTAGGTPYGPSHHAFVDNHGPVTDQEAALATAMGRRLAETALKLAGGSR
jgi:NAD(P)H dehydrogenase (quinone)